MAIKITRKDWNNQALKDITLVMSELTGEDIIIVEPKLKLYNAQIWKNDDIVFEKDFDDKLSALKWIKSKLEKESLAYADLKRYNNKRDDFDWWFYKVKNNQLVDVTDCGGNL